MILSVAGLAGCQGQVSVDLTTEPAAERDLNQVVAGVRGLEFSKSDGSTETLEYPGSEPVDFMDFQSGNLLTLFTNEPLPPGTYTGVRLLFDASETGRFIVDDFGTSFPLLLSSGNYADFDFTVEDEESSSASLTLTLDLRQSLSFSIANAEYTLQPYLRSVPADEAGILEGAVLVSCPAGTSLLEGGAVFLFKGRNIVPDDRDGDAVEPYATAALTFNALDQQFNYRMLDLPPGDYTLAATCRAGSEDPATDSQLDFRGVRNVALDRETVTVADVAD